MTEPDRTTSDYASHAPTYHTNKDSPYVLPNGGPEHARLETQARHLSAIMGGRVIHSPILDNAAKRILDVGCGTGVVSDHLARSFPTADVIGLDLSPVPQLRDRPSNVRFVQGNILTDSPSDWKASRDSESRERSQKLPDEAAFDLIYSRLLVCGMSEWPRYIRKEFSLLKSGGWAEVHDVDWIWYDKQDRIISDDWPWWRELRSVGESRGLDFSCASRARQWMKDAGFADVQVDTYRWPFGGKWEKEKVWQEFGEYGSSAMTDMVWHMIPRMMEGRPGVTSETIDQMRADMQRDFAPEEGKHWVFYVTCGRKP
ncbi:hypothetical protein B0A55_07431 [Friedmanniomyces simplex]|uniref:Methyltransferase domain-containing protein n=1 Tax=Friedmanniomyces simplex TaxID=329884 RepID=A0A4U0X6G0_9PEZI|nr:hypothetical protein B0A55_07431 [Friedmanniomyces simplex]